MEVMDQQREPVRRDSIYLWHRGHQFIEMRQHAVQLSKTSYIRVRHGHAGIQHKGIAFGRNALTHQPHSIDFEAVHWIRDRRHMLDDPRIIRWRSGFLVRISTGILR
ncbi:hypothetical protein ACW9HE_13020 [Nocardia gipuzkoensis]|uniref:hypothetical protein n=1 Tax=Nocardia abscessus TaxID=120957 RepID=UPI0024586727|nr:hypothetical protein [Nocardia abscessus]